ncbi:MAG: nickel pincer cofactor biosynthesis protein LarB [bacterium]|nr:nickel pincer cofactor biosynthesis protein LarB [bacterium]
MEVEAILEEFRAGRLELGQAIARLKGIEELGFARLDLSREKRTGFGEVVYGASKSLTQLEGIIGSFKRRSERLLVTRLGEDKAKKLCAIYSELEYRPASRLLVGPWGPEPRRLGRLAVLTAGTADIQVAEEAAAVAEYLGAEVHRYFDMGVAGPHRLFSKLEEIQQAQVVIVVAGMDGALPSLVGGLLRRPLVAVPTSVGYGAGFDGLAPLLTMLNSCAAGVSVVNIDNGFGAAFSAAKILLLARDLIDERASNQP